MGKAPSVVRENQFSAEKRTPSTIICHHDPDLSGEVISQTGTCFRRGVRSKGGEVQVLPTDETETSKPSSDENLPTKGFDVSIGIYVDQRSPRNALTINSHRTRRQTRSRTAEISSFPTEVLQRGLEGQTPVKKRFF